MARTRIRPDRTKCAKKDNDGQCCCNCHHRRTVMVHPWVTGTSIRTPVGIFICTGLMDDTSETVIVSHAHGDCEIWEER